MLITLSRRSYTFIYCCFLFLENLNNFLGTTWKTLVIIVNFSVAAIDNYCMLIRWSRRLVNNYTLRNLLELDQAMNWANKRNIPPRVKKLDGMVANDK